MQVCVPSTPAQMFHMLRRQMKRSLRLPLVVMTPKSLLRHPQSVSALEDLTKGRFQPLIGESEPHDPQKIKRVVFCSGKVYFDLVDGRKKLEARQAAIVRIEQLYPFPRDEFNEALAKYPNASEIVWCQEEPENQGAWYQIKHKLLAYTQDQKHELIYVSRKGTSTTAVGYLKVHQKEQEELVRQALTAGKREKDRVIP
jgi:2-oxoglutarate dehydrogenase E1 component